MNLSYSSWSNSHFPFKMWCCHITCLNKKPTGNSTKKRHVKNIWLAHVCGCHLLLQRKEEAGDEFQKQSQRRKRKPLLNEVLGLWPLKHSVPSVQPKLDHNAMKWNRPPLEETKKVKKDKNENRKTPRSLKTSCHDHRKFDMKKIKPLQTRNKNESQRRREKIEAPSKA